VWSGHSCPLACSSQKPAGKSARSTQSNGLPDWRTMIGAAGGKLMNAKRL